MNQTNRTLLARSSWLPFFLLILAFISVNEWSPIKLGNTATSWMLYLFILILILREKKTLYDTSLVGQDFDYDSWANGKRVYITTCYPFYGGMQDGDFDIFKPIDSIQAEIDETFKRMGGQYSRCTRQKNRQ